MVFFAVRSFLFCVLEMSFYYCYDGVFILLLFCDSDVRIFLIYFFFFFFFFFFFCGCGGGNRV